MEVGISLNGKYHDYVVATVVHKLKDTGESLCCDQILNTQALGATSGPNLNTSLRNTSQIPYLLVNAMKQRRRANCFGRFNVLVNAFENSISSILPFSIPHEPRTPLTISGPHLNQKKSLPRTHEFYDD